MKRKYIFIAVNVPYIVVLTVAAFLMGDIQRQDFARMRSKIRASSSMDDLQSRALAAISALESGEKVTQGVALG